MSQEPKRQPQMVDCASTVSFTLRALLVYFLRLGTLGFGGPIALAGHMQKDLVEERRWVSKQDYLEGLAFSQLSPGPLAAQLAMYLGWIRAGTIGATLVGIAFILPSFLMVLVLAALYVHFGSLPWIQGMFYGIGAAVIAIIVRSAIKLVRGTVGRDWLLWAIFTALAITTAWTKSEFVWLSLLCGAIAMFVKAPPLIPSRATSAMFVGGVGPLLTGIHGLASIATVGVLFLFFLKAGAFVFGSGLAIVPLLYGGVVAKFHWLTERQFVDAVAVAMITPGPVVITAAVIGYVVAGLVGALVAVWAVFAPRNQGIRVSLADRPQISVCLFVLGLLCDASLLLNAQPQQSAQAKERQIGAQEPLRTAKASRVDRAPKLDGTLDDPIWQQA